VGPAGCYNAANNVSERLTAALCGPSIRRPFYLVLRRGAHTVTPVTRGANPKKGGVFVRDYELMVVFGPGMTEEQIPESIEKVSQSVSALGGHVTEEQHTAPWGRRKLAYPIRHQREGFYVVYKLQIDGDQADELDRAMKLNEGVLRHLLTRIEG
jgi:small subunit ribosomal protein S6